jgi:hypothetical protein
MYLKCGFFKLGFHILPITVTSLRLWILTELGTSDKQFCKLSLVYVRSKDYDIIVC